MIPVTVGETSGHVGASFLICTWSHQPIIDQFVQSVFGQRQPSCPSLSQVPATGVLCSARRSSLVSVFLFATVSDFLMCTGEAAGHASCTRPCALQSYLLASEQENCRESRSRLVNDRLGASMGLERWRDPAGPSSDPLLSAFVARRWRGSR